MKQRSVIQTVMMAFRHAGAKRQAPRLYNLIYPLPFLFAKKFKHFARAFFALETRNVEVCPKTDKLYMMMIVWLS